MLIEAVVILLIVALQILEVMCVEIKGSISIVEISEESTLKIYRILANIGNKIYNFAYISDILNYNSNIDIAEKIITSIQIS